MSSDADLNNLLDKLVNGEVEEQVRASYALENMGEPAVLPLIELLKKRDIHWDLIVRTLGGIGDKQAVEPLIESLETLNSFNERHGARKSIAFALGNLKDARAVDVLLIALNQRFYETDRYDGTLKEEFDEETIEAVEWALTKIGDPRALEPIFQRIFEDRYQYSDVLKEWG